MTESRPNERSMDSADTFREEAMPHARKTARYAYSFLVIAFVGLFWMAQSATFWGLTLFVPGIVGAMTNAARSAVAVSGRTVT